MKLAESLLNPFRTRKKKGEGINRIEKGREGVEGSGRKGEGQERGRERGREVGEQGREVRKEVGSIGLAPPLSPSLPLLSLRFAERVNVYIL